MSIKREAWLRGSDSSLYEPGNNGLVIGDYGSMAKRLFDKEKISEGHYWELLNLIGYGEGENCTGADVLIHFSKAGQRSILPTILLKYEYINLSTVFEEIKSIQKQINNQVLLLRNLAIEPFNPSGEMRLEYALLSTRFGKGEGACITRA